MSQEELVGAYLDGRMSRRTLVRRLVAGGVTVGAAVAYAQLLEPAPATGRGSVCGAHFDASVKIPAQDLDRVIEKQGLRVKATADRAMNLFVEVYLLRPDHPLFERSRLGDRQYSFPAAGSLTKRIAFDQNPPFSLKAVKRERRDHGKAKFEVLAHGFVSGEGSSSFFHQRTIKI